jgi:hypothetical protein
MRKVLFLESHLKATIPGKDGLVKTLSSRRTNFSARLVCVPKVDGEYNTLICPDIITALINNKHIVTSKTVLDVLEGRLYEIYGIVRRKRCRSLVPPVIPIVLYESGVRVKDSVGQVATLRIGDRILTKTVDRVFANRNPCMKPCSMRTWLLRGGGEEDVIEVSAQDWEKVQGDFDGDAAGLVATTEKRTTPVCNANIPLLEIYTLGRYLVSECLKSVLHVKACKCALRLAGDPQAIIVIAKARCATLQVSQDVIHRTFSKPKRLCMSSWNYLSIHGEYPQWERDYHSICRMYLTVVDVVGVTITTTPSDHAMIIAISGCRGDIETYASLYSRIGYVQTLTGYKDIASCYMQGLSVQDGRVMCDLATQAAVGKYVGIAEPIKQAMDRAVLYGRVLQRDGVIYRSY